jgi:GT2 family glycosyltransferase
VSPRALPALAAIVVTHDNAADLGACLDSLAAHAGGVPLSVIVADCGSRDEGPAIARRRGTLVLEGPNVGFGGGNNRALRHVGHVPYVLLINPDAQIVDGSLDALVDRAAAAPQVAAWGLRHVDQTGNVIPTIEAFPGVRREWRLALGRP